MRRKRSESLRSKNSIIKDNKNTKNFSNNSSGLCTIPLGEQVIQIHPSYANVIKPFVEKGLVPSLNVSRVWLEKNKTGYVLHIGDLDDIPFD